MAVRWYEMEARIEFHGSMTGHIRIIAPNAVDAEKRIRALTSEMLHTKFVPDGDPVNDKRTFGAVTLGVKAHIVDARGEDA